MNKLIIIGAGGHGKVVADAAACTNHWKEIVFADKRYPDLLNAGHWPVINDHNDLDKFEKNSCDYIVAIGDNNIRHKLHNELKEKGFNLVNVIHPTSEISDYTELGIGNVVMANAVINVDTIIGDACIINTSATVDHDCIIGDSVHISPGANLAGQVEVGKHSWIGIGATVNQLVVIGENVTLGSGSVAIENIPDGKTATGIPAKY
jgi:sugar O-acyltransferase (sialic acid O-acetyltransferase NeuD family)